MSDLYVGWDVGGWNCDRNPASRDGLCAIEVLGSELVVAGAPWHGNLRELLVSHDGDTLLNAMLRKLGIADDQPRAITVAIDAPLGWPTPMVELVAHGRLADVPPEADCNPYLLRAQDLALFGKGCRPLSPVRDMIGSQSTKGIHFLKRAGLSRARTGVWSRGRISGIETYHRGPNCRGSGLGRGDRDVE